ncbi:MAG: DNA polymerase III subunit gamma and tau [bacterium]
MALYRTYRPGTLAEVVGQEHVTQPLGRALAQDRLHHAYLFSGPRGCGKTSTARILARSMNCEQGPTAEPCGVCQSCVDLAPNGPGSIDVIELDAASHGGVDDTRDLRERAMFAPVSSRYKIYIVDEAHMVSPAGFNALLKVVEEPPEHVRFIFATTEADKVLPTIRSRTHHYTFRLVPARLLQQHLADICAREGVAADPAALALVARSAGGSVRDSLSLLGQLVAGSGPDGVTYDLAASTLGVTESALLDATVEAISSGDGAALFGVIDRVVEAGHDPRRFATDLLQRFRDLIVIAAMPADDAQQLLDVPDAEWDAMEAQSRGMGLAELSRAADLVSEGLSELRGATAPRLALELLGARLLLPSSDDSQRGLAARLDRLERGAPMPPVSAPAEPTAARRSRSAPAPAAPPPAVPPPAAPPPAVRPMSEVLSGTPEPAPGAPSPAAPPERSGPSEAALTLADIATMWPAVLEGLKSMSRVAWMLFSDSTPVSWEDGVLAVSVPDVGKANNARANGHDQRLRQVILDSLRVDVRVDVVAGGTSVAPAPAAVAADLPSPDDADDSEVLTGESLAMRELGATVIGEIEQG